MAADLRKTWSVWNFSSSIVRCYLRYFTSQVTPSYKKYSSHLLWSKEVNSFGKLRYFGGVELHVRPPNVWEGQGNRVTVHLLSDADNEVLQEFRNEYEETLNCEVSDGENKKEYSDITVNIDAATKCDTSIVDSSKLLVEIPHCYDVDINTLSTKKLTVEKLEGDINIEAVSDCFLSQLKSPSITVNSISGSITGKLSLIGDVTLTTVGDGDITLDKVQGNNVNMSAKNGHISVKSLYCGDAQLSSGSGDVLIGDAHGKVNLSSCDGQVVFLSVSGQLKAVLHHGDIEAKVTKTGKIDATNLNGNATIKIDNDLQCRLDLSARSIDISSDCEICDRAERISDDKVSVTGEIQGTGEQCAKVRCPNGRIKLLRESWFVFPDD